MRTATTTTESLLTGGGANFSLCHGLAGNAECIREAEPELGTVVTDSDIAHRVAWHGIERYASTGLRWPCGTHTDESPGLMLGLAGIGSFYLRLAEPGLGTVLMPTRPAVQAPALGRTSMTKADVLGTGTLAAD
jgi:lantibiotic modifying enzyme